VTTANPHKEKGVRYDTEETRLQEAARAPPTGRSGGPTSASGSGARFVKTTAKMERLGLLYSLTILTMIASAVLSKERS